MSVAHIAQRLRTSSIDLRTFSDAYARSIISERSESVRERFPVGSLAVKLDDQQSHTTLSGVVTSLGPFLDILLMPPNDGGITLDWCLNATATLRDNGYPDVEVHWLDEGTFTLTIAGKWLRQPITQFKSISVRPECVRIQFTDTDSKRMSYQRLHEKEFIAGKGINEEVIGAARLRKAGWPIRMDIDGIGHIDVDVMLAMSNSDSFSTDAHILESIYALGEDREDFDGRAWLFDPQPVLERYLLRLWSSGVPVEVLAAMVHWSYAETVSWLRSTQLHGSKIGMCPLSNTLPLPVHAKPDPRLMQRDIDTTALSERFCAQELEIIRARSLRDKTVQVIMSGARARGITVPKIIDALFPDASMSEAKFRRYLKQLGITITDKWQYDVPKSERDSFREGWSDHSDDFLNQTFLDVVNGTVPIQWIAKHSRVPEPKAWELLYFGHLRHTISIGEPIALDGQ